MKVFSGTSNTKLYDDIIGCLGERCRGNIHIDRFRDGEICVQYGENIRGKDVFLVQSTSSPVNDNLMELLIMVDAAKRASAKHITAVIPFYGYARQDRKDKPRVPITAKLVANLLVASGVDRVLTVDLHSHQIQGFFDVPLDHLYSFPVFTRYFKERWSEEFRKNELMVLAPDAGSAKSAVKYANVLGCGVAICSKNRINGESIQTQGLIGEVKGKTIVLMDDLTTTGGTLCGAADIAMEKGAKEVIAGVVHNVATLKGLDKMIASPIKELIVTDTVAKQHDIPFVKSLSIAPLLADAIGRIHENDSVSSLFDI
tara:strand:+ start:10282 stop:11223 length:942 start_codon:yes stop_codon:yes gene_type:complete